MARAKLSIELPEATWVGAVTPEFPDAELRVHSAIPRESGGVALIEVLAEAPEAFLAAAADHPALAEFDVAEAAAERALVSIETTHPMVIDSLREAGVPVDPPVRVVDGRAEVEVTAPRDRLSGFGEVLADRGLSFEVEYVRSHPEPDETLTDAQRDLLALALSEGYYETPRELTLTQLAEAAGVAKSTASERLHRAESAVIKEFAAGAAAMEYEE